jgi:glycosyltransferase involved in cell wall biosynthesis
MIANENKEDKKTYISIALPVYNGANYLEAALETILSQEFRDFELVISDNFSTDATPEILSKYAKLDKRIKVSRSEKHLPLADNVNRAIDLCSSTWVKLFCHDDLMKPNCLKSIYKIIKDSDNSLGLIGNGEEALFMNGYTHTPIYNKSQKFLKKDSIRELLAGKMSVGLPAVTTATVRKEAWEKAGKFDSRFLHFDVFFWVRLLMEWDYFFIAEPLIINRIHGAQISNNVRKGKTIQEHEKFWKEFLKEFGEDLNLDFSSILKTRLKAVSVAGTTVAIEILKYNFYSALVIGLKTPIFWWPILPFFIMRSLKNEAHKVFVTLKDVPASIIYPT